MPSQITKFEALGIENHIEADVKISIIQDRLVPIDSHYIKKETVPSGEYYGERYLHSFSENPLETLLMKSMAEAAAISDHRDPFQKDALMLLVNDYLRSANLGTYDEFAAQADISFIETGRYQGLAPRKKRRLFDYTAKLLIAAIATASKSQVFSREQIFGKLDRMIIQPFKPEINEPTYETVKKALAQA